MASLRGNPASSSFMEFFESFSMHVHRGDLSINIYRGLKLLYTKFFIKNSQVNSTVIKQEGMSSNE